MASHSNKTTPLSGKVLPLSRMLAHFCASPRIPGPRTRNLVAPGLEPGTLTHTNMTELASVIDTKTDKFGICHIHFLLAHQYQYRVT